MRLICKRVRNDPKNREYMDLSLEPVIENETQSLELFQSEAAKKFVEKRHRFEKMRHSVTPTSWGTWLKIKSQWINRNYGVLEGDEVVSTNMSVPVFGWIIVLF